VVEYHETVHTEATGVCFIVCAYRSLAPTAAIPLFRYQTVLMVDLHNNDILMVNAVKMGRNSILILNGGQSLVDRSVPKKTTEWTCKLYMAIGNKLEWYVA